MSNSGHDAGTPRWKSRAFDQLSGLVDRARETLADPARREALLDEVKVRLRSLSQDPAWGELRDQAGSAVRLVQAATAGRYKLRSAHSLWLVGAALLYLVLPIDAIPDVIPGLGMLDDAAVLTFVFTKLARELERFREWERWRQEFAADDEA